MNNVITVFLLFSMILPLLMNDSEVFATENQITLSTQKPQDSPAGKFLDLVYTEAFKRMGMIFVYKTFPAKRSSFMSDTGKVDGELSRIYSYNEVHPNLVRVEEPHWTSGFIAAASDTSIHLAGWDSLKNTDYKVTYMAGIKGCETNLPKVVRPENLDIIMHTSHGYRMVLKGRADIHIGSEMDMLSVLESDEFRGLALEIVGVMDKFTGHAFLNEKHQELVPKLSSVLKEMKKEGLFEKYRNVSKLITYIND
jgi:polar amino acid transport system substrate-binding protein